MAKVDIWIPVYIGDYLRDTQNLTAEEHGVYFLLLMYYWQKKGEIGSDLKRLAIVAKSTQETTEGILTMFFDLVDGNYCNKRADKELQDAQSRSESARANVKKRWEKDTPVIPPYYRGNTDDDTESIRNGYSSSSSSSSEEFKAAGKQISTNPARDTEPERPACLPAVDIQELKDRIKKAPFPSSFTSADYQAFAARLGELQLGIGFVDYCIDRVAADRGATKPAGLLKSGLLQYPDWVEEYQDKKPGGYVTLAPELGPCDQCGSELNANRFIGEAVCPSCRRSWTYDREWEQWFEDETHNPVADTG